MTDHEARPRDRDLVTLFTKALRKLGEAGEVDAACKLAADAWWSLKDTDERAAERVNGTMHYLARLPQPAGQVPAPQARPAAVARD